MAPKQMVPPRVATLVLASRTGVAISGKDTTPPPLKKGAYAAASITATTTKFR